MVSSAKNRREKGKWKIEIGKWKFGNRLGEKQFSTENTEFAESAEKKKISNEEIENEKKKAEKEKNRRAVDAAARKVRYGTDESYRDGFQAGFFAEGIERAGRRIARKVAPEKRKLIVEPHGEITAAAPHQRGASQEQEVPDNGQGPEPRACSPIHKSSPAPTQFV
jgi:hypothetical protein